MKSARRLPIFFSSFCFVLLLAFLTIFFSQASKEVKSRLAGETIIQRDGRFNSSEALAIFHNQFISPPSREIAFRKEVKVLSAGTEKDRWIEIDLTNQRLRAHENEKIIYDFSISSGKPWTPTITGNFRIWSKFKYNKMSGGSRALGTYYYLPNVPFTMYFHNDYGIHGTYWHNNFGHPMSHGCVNMRTPDVEKLFYWARPHLNQNQWSIRATSQNQGTRVVVHGKTPKS